MCEQLDKVLAAASGKFAALKGEAVKDQPNMWTAAVALPGGSDCLVAGDSDQLYVCTLYAGDDTDTARNVYDTNADRIGKCLGEGWKSEESADAETRKRTFSKGAQKVRLSSEIGRAEARTVQLFVDPVAE